MELSCPCLDSCALLERRSLLVRDGRRLLPAAVTSVSSAIRAAAAALDTAIARMGGEETLRRIERVRFEIMTLWQRMTFDEPTVGSHRDVRAAQRPP